MALVRGARAAAAGGRGAGTVVTSATAPACDSQLQAGAEAERLSVNALASRQAPSPEEHPMTASPDRTEALSPPVRRSHRKALIAVSSVLAIGLAGALASALAFQTASGRAAGKGELGFGKLATAGANPHKPMETLCSDATPTVTKGVTSQQCWDFVSANPSTAALLSPVGINPAVIGTASECANGGTACGKSSPRSASKLSKASVPSSAARTSSAAGSSSGAGGGAKSGTARCIASPRSPVGGSSSAHERRKLHGDGGSVSVSVSGSGAKVCVKLPGAPKRLPKPKKGLPKPPNPKSLPKPKKGLPKPPKLPPPKIPPLPKLPPPLVLPDNL
jgi:hypothetical protein